MSKSKIWKFLLWFLGFGLALTFSNFFFWDEKVNSAGEVTEEAMGLAVFIMLVTLIVRFFLNKDKKKKRSKLKGTAKYLFDNYIKKDTNYLLLLAPFRNTGLIFSESLYDFYDLDKSTYNFPDFMVMKRVPIKQLEVVKFKAKDYLNEFTENNKLFSLIILRELGGDQFNPTVVQIIEPKDFSVEIPNNKDSVQKMISEKKHIVQLREEILIKQRKINEQHLSKMQDIKDQQDDSRMLHNNLLNCGLTEKDIAGVLNFFDRPIVAKNRTTQIFEADNGSGQIPNALSVIKEVKNERELELFLSRKHYELVFDPTNEDDLYSIESKEFKLLTDLGMVDLSDSYPPLLNVRNINFKKNWSMINYVKDRKLSIANTNDEITVSNGYEFETFVADILEKNNYSDIEVTKKSGDQGVDILAKSSDNVCYVFQVKYYTGMVGNDAVQQVLAGKSYYSAHVGVVVTNSHFTKSAKELALKTGVLLWDAEQLEVLSK